MVEITCPNCSARYEVPAEALGANGRDVTCSSCGHIWLAMAPQPGPAGPPPDPAPRPPEPEAASAPDRRRQRADLRRMLDEVQASEQEAPASEPPGRRSQPHTAERWRDEAEPPRPQRRERQGTRTVDRAGDRRGGDDEDAELFLREQMGLARQDGRARAGRNGEGHQRRKLMEKHEARQQQAEKKARHRAGAGYTAFVLVLLTGAVFVGLYTLAPEIVARFPDAEPAMQTYVETVEKLRRDIAEGYETVSILIADRIG